MSRFGDKLHSLRVKKNLSQSDLSKIIGVVPSAIGMYERNQRQPDFETVCKIANFFDVSVDYLINQSSSEKKTPTINEIINVLHELKNFRIQNKIPTSLLAQILNTTETNYLNIENGNFLTPTQFDIIRFLISMPVELISMNGFHCTENAFNEINQPIKTKYLKLAEAAQNLNLSDEEIESLINLCTSLKKEK